MGFKARMAAAIAMVAGLTLAGGDARAMTLRDTNLVDLIRQSDSIVLGQVMAVSDGVNEIGLPYTEVTVAISERLRGDEEGTLSFRQIGLLAARPTQDGTRMMLPAPEGMPQYTVGEEVLLFMGHAASMTGLRTPTGLATGKFTLGAGNAENGLGNRGVFTNISVERGITTPNDDRILSTPVGAVNDEDLKSLVRRAVSARWVETCAMWSTDEGKTCGPSRQRKATVSRPREGSINTSSGTTSGSSTLGR